MNKVTPEQFEAVRELIYSNLVNGTILLYCSA